jgi:hypothetical protein
MENIDPKLLKIIALAKAGIGGERESAIALVRKICDREGIDFDAVMSDNGDMPKEYETDIKMKSKDEMRIVIQVAARFATTPEHPGVRGGWYRGYNECFVKYTTTAARHIETLNAIDAYLKVYRREKKNMLEALKEAFTAKHSLYPQFDQDDDEAEPKAKTAEERLKTWRAANIMQGLTESVNLQKQIGGSKNGG